MIKGVHMKKVFKRIAIGIFSIIVLWVSVHHVLKVRTLQIERKDQTFVEVNGLKMHYDKAGDGGENIVLMNGFGTPYPSFDFRLLLNELKSNHTLYMIEPFGYGTSDLTSEVRSIKNMTEELHEAISRLGLDEYYLMGHSISGLYSVHYMAQYPSEVKGFIGIDSSVPTQDLPDAMNLSLVYKGIDFLGLYRLASIFSNDLLPEAYLDMFSEDDFKRIKAMTASRMNNKTVVNEMDEMVKNFKRIRKINLPIDIPILIFLSQESVDGDGRWLDYHNDYYKNSQVYEVKILEGTHYLHHNQAQTIAESVNNFINGVDLLE